MRGRTYSILLTAALFLVAVIPEFSLAGDNSRAWITVSKEVVLDSGNNDTEEMSLEEESFIDADIGSGNHTKLVVMAEQLGGLRGYHLAFDIPQPLIKYVSWVCGTAISTPLPLSKYDKKDNLFHVWVVVMNKGPINYSESAFLGELIINSPRASNYDYSCVIYEFVDSSFEMDELGSSEPPVMLGSDQGERAYINSEEEFEGVAINPNPFNPSTNIKFKLTNEGLVKIKIFNVKGELVKTLVDRHMSQGIHSVQWNGCNDNEVAVSSGIYFCTVGIPTETATKKLVLLR